MAQNNFFSVAAVILGGALAYDQVFNDGETTERVTERVVEGGQVVRETIVEGSSQVRETIERSSEGLRENISDLNPVNALNPFSDFEFPSFGGGGSSSSSSNDDSRSLGGTAGDWIGSNAADLITGAIGSYSSAVWDTGAQWGQDARRSFDNWWSDVSFSSGGNIPNSSSSSSPKAVQQYSEPIGPEKPKRSIGSSRSSSGSSGGGSSSGSSSSSGGGSSSRSFFSTDAASQFIRENSNSSSGESSKRSIGSSGGSKSSKEKKETSAIDVVRSYRPGGFTNGI